MKIVAAVIGMIFGPSRADILEFVVDMAKFNMALGDQVQTMQKSLAALPFTPPELRARMNASSALVESEIERMEARIQQLEK